MSLPLAKLFDLVLKTLSKPLAKAIKRRAASHPKFRASISNWAQSYHRLTVKLQRRLYGGQSAEAHIKRLNEEKAVSTASDVLGEFIVFGVAGAVVITEAARSARSNARKEAKLRAEREALHERDRQLQEEIMCLKERLEQMEHSMATDSWLPRVLSGLGAGVTSSSSSSTSSSSSSSSAIAPFAASSSPSSSPTAAAAGGERRVGAEGGEGGSSEGGDGEGYGEVEEGEETPGGGSNGEGSREAEGGGEKRQKAGVMGWVRGWMGGWGGRGKAAASDAMVSINDMEGGDGAVEGGGGGEGGEGVGEGPVGGASGGARVS